METKCDFLCGWIKKKNKKKQKQAHKKNHGYMIFLSLTDEFWQQKHSMHHPWRQNVTTSVVGLKQQQQQQQKRVTYAKFSPQMVNPRYIAGKTDEGWLLCF